MALTEKLQWILTADAKGAIKAFQDTGKAADKELGKAEAKIDKLGGTLTKVGAGAVAFAGVAGVALFKAGNAASNLNESVNAVNVSFGEAGKGILKLSDDAAKSVGLSKTSFNELAVSFSANAEKIAGDGGNVVGVIDDLTTRGADFASVMNLNVNEAMSLFRSGLAGESEPLRKFGIDLSAASVEAFAYADGIADVGDKLTEAEKVQARYGLLMQETSKFAGDFANTSEGLANQQRILKAELDNLVAGVGQGVVPVMTNVVSLIGSVVEKFNALPGPVQKAVGGFATIGTIGLGAAGALSVIVGQAIKMRDNLAPLVGKLKTAEGGLTNLGKAAKTAGIALGALALVDIGGDVFNNMTDASGKLERSLNRTLIAVGDFKEGTGSASTVMEKFRDLVADEDGKFKLKNFTDLSSEIHIVGGSTTRAMGDIKDAFDKIIDTSPEMAKAVLDAYRLTNAEAIALLDTMEPGTDEFERQRKMVIANGEVLNKLGDIYDETVGAQEAVTAANEAGTEAADDNADATTRMYQEYAEGRRKADELSTSTDGVTAAEKAAEKAADDLADAQGRAAQKADELQREFDELKGSLSDEEAWLGVEQSFADMQTAAEEAWIATQSGADDAAQKQRDYRQSVIDTKQGIIDYAKEVLGLPAEVVTAIIADLDEGDVAAVEQKLKILTRNRTMNIDIVTKGGPGYGPKEGFADGGRVGRSGAYIVGEEGPEIVNLNAGDYVTPNDRLPRVGTMAAGGVTFASTPIGGQSQQAAQAPQGPTPEEAARAAEEAAREAIEREDRIQAAMFETGDISLAAYRKYLEGRQASTKKYDEDWMSAWRTLRSLREEESRQSEEAAQAELKRQEEAAQATLDRIKLAYEQAKALRELQQAERDVADAMDDIREAEEDLWNADDEDKDRAAEGVQRAIERAAEEMFRGAGARASANGLAAGTPEWARFVRREVEQAMRDFPLLAGVLGQLLVGVPNLAHGGIVKARPGGTLIRAGEAGRDEAVVPLPMGGGRSAPLVVVEGNIYGDSHLKEFLQREVVPAIQRYDKFNGTTWRN